MIFFWCQESVLLILDLIALFLVLDAGFGCLVSFLFLLFLEVSLAKRTHEAIILIFRRTALSSAVLAIMNVNRVWLIILRSLTEHQVTIGERTVYEYVITTTL